MSQSTQILELRNQLHKHIVQQTVRSAGAATGAWLQLQREIQAAYTYQDNQDQDHQVTVRIHGIDGTTGELLAVTAENDQRRIRYCDLTVEQLSQLFDYIIGKKFTVKN